MIEPEGEVVNQGRMHSLHTSADLGPQIDPVAEAQKLEIFPPSMAGYIAKVRFLWVLYAGQRSMTAMNQYFAARFTMPCAVLSLILLDYCLQPQTLCIKI
jgi:hypothetical protein